MKNLKFVIYGVISLAGLILAWWVSGNKGSDIGISSSRPATMQRTETRMSSPPPSEPVQPRSDEVLIGQLGVIIPENWQAEPPSSSMRIAQFRIPTAGDDQIELAVTSGIRGGVQANVNRWYGQFQNPNGRDTTFVNNNMQISLVDIRGTFLGMEAEIGSENYQMLAAIVEAPDGHYFFKLTGPQETVSSLSNSFASFIGTIRYVGNQ